MKEHIEEGKIALLAGDDLTAREADELAEHLAECPACSARLLKYQKGRRALASLRDIEIDANDFDQVRASVWKRRDEAAISRFWSWTSPRWSAAAALILIAIAIAAWHWRNASAPETSQHSGTGKTILAPQVPARIKTPAAVSASTAADHAKVIPPMKRSSASRATPAMDFGLAALNRADAWPAAKSSSPPVLDDVFMKLETSDPNVIIIWLANSKGAGR